MNSRLAFGGGADASYPLQPLPGYDWIMSVISPFYTLVFFRPTGASRQRNNYSRRRRSQYIIIGLLWLSLRESIEGGQHEPIMFHSDDDSEQEYGF